MSTNASRDTTTGLKFEKEVTIKSNGEDLSKYKLYQFLAKKGIDWKTIISRKLLPDECYYDGITLYVYEKKYQKTEGSADEKPQTCGFKIWQFKKIAAAMGVKNCKYVYILSDWFKQPKYKDMLDYIKSVPDCDYMFKEDVN